MIHFAYIPISIILFQGFELFYILKHYQTFVYLFDVHVYHKQKNRGQISHFLVDNNSKLDLHCELNLMH